MIEIDILPAPTPTPTSPSARKDAADEFASAMQDATGRESTPTGEAEPERDDAQPDHPGPDRAADAARADHAAQDTPSPDGVGTAPDALSTPAYPAAGSVVDVPVADSVDMPTSIEGVVNGSDADAVLPVTDGETKAKGGTETSNRPDTVPDHLGLPANTKPDVTPPGLTVAVAAVAGDHRGDSSIVPGLEASPGNAGPAHEIAQPGGAGVATDEIGLGPVASAAAVESADQTGQPVDLPMDPSLSAETPAIPASVASGGEGSAADPSAPSNAPIDTSGSVLPDAVAEALSSNAATGGEAPAPSAVASPSAPATVPADVAVAAAVETLAPVPATTPAAATAVDPTAAAEAAAAAELDIPTPPQQIAEALRDVRRLADGSHRLSLQLYPEELGVVQLEVAVRDGQLHLRAATELESTRRLLTASLPELRGQLAEAGVSAGSLEVGAETAGGDRSARDGSPDTAQSASHPSSPAPASATTEATTSTSTPTAAGRLDVRI